MAPSNGVPGGAHPQLEPDERALLELASSIPTDGRPLSEIETRILRLYDRVHEQRLEEALLRQDPPEIGEVDNVNEQVAKAERELLEARASCSLQKKAVEAVLMTAPTVQSIHSEAKTEVERALSRLVNRRDILSLIYENLARAHWDCLERLSNAEVENMKIADENKQLAGTLLELTKAQPKTGKDLITDPQLKEQVEALEAEGKQKKADWVTLKRIVSATIVASGVDWASDDNLRDLVLDEADEGA